jgi:hypothetical protein
MIREQLVKRFGHGLSVAPYGIKPALCSRIIMKESFKNAAGIVVAYGTVFQAFLRCTFPDLTAKTP